MSLLVTFWSLPSLFTKRTFPTAPQGIGSLPATTLTKSRRPPQKEPCKAPRRPRRTLQETPPQRPLRTEANFLGEPRGGLCPRMVTLRNFKNSLEACENFCPLQGSFGPFRPKVGKRVQKWVPGASRPRGPKSRKRSRKRVKIDCFSTILTLFRLRFRLFGPRGREAPGTHFRTLFPTLGPKGPNDLCSRQKFSQLEARNQCSRRPCKLARPEGRNPHLLHPTFTAAKFPESEVLTWWRREWEMNGWKRGKDPHPQDFSLTKKTARFTKDKVRPY